MYIEEIEILIKVKKYMDSFRYLYRSTRIRDTLIYFTMPQIHGTKPDTCTEINRLHILDPIWDLVKYFYRATCTYNSLSFMYKATNTSNSFRQVYQATRIWNTFKYL